MIDKINSSGYIPGHVPAIGKDVISRRNILKRRSGGERGEERPKESEYKTLAKKKTRKTTMYRLQN
jgi:hypothetical protein